MAGQRRHRQRGAARGRFQQQAIGLARGALDQVQDMPPHAAAQIVRQHQDGRPIGAAEQLHGDGEAVRPRRVELHMLCHQSRVVRIALRAARTMALLRGRRRAGAEAHRALVIDEGVAGQQMPPAARAGTQAEIVLLAVAAAERLDVEQADLGQRRAADIHAEADRGRQLDAASGIRRAAGGIQLGHAEAERGWAAPRCSDSRRSWRCWRTARPRPRAASHRRARRAARASLPAPRCRCSAAPRRASPAASMPMFTEATKP